MVARLPSTFQAASPRISVAMRARIARQGEQYLRQRLTKRVKVTELCEAVGASERTLELAFVESFGMSPRQLLKTLRLNGAHRDLREATAATSVTSVALGWGFLHLGRFSVAYREMFGETAVTTLRRALAATIHANKKEPAALSRQVA